MTMVIFVVIAIVFVLAGVGGVMYVDHLFAASVAGRSYAVKGKKVETDDPYVRKQFRKFYALRVGYSVTLLVLLLVTVSYVG